MKAKIGKDLKINKGTTIAANILFKGIAGSFSGKIFKDVAPNQSANGQTNVVLTLISTITSYWSNTASSSASNQTINKIELNEKQE